MRYSQSIIYCLGCTASLAIACSSPVYAQDSAKVPEVVVTATRSPIALSKVASSMTVIDRNTIERKHRKRLTELLQEVPGVSVASNGTPGQTTRIFMRGTNSNHVLVMMDGVVLNDPSDPGNAFDYSNMSTDNIERIEVLRGPQSTLYGSQALGGVINIITRKGEGKPISHAYAEYGSYNSRAFGAGNRGKIGNTSYSFEVSHAGSSGISAVDRSSGGNERDSSSSYTMAGNFATEASDDLIVKGSARYSRNSIEFDSPGSFVRSIDDPFPESDSRQFNGRFAGEWKMDNEWTHELGISALNLNRSLITEYFDSMFNTFFGRQQFHGKRETIDWIHRIKPADNHEVVVGLEAWTESFKSSSLGEQNVDNRAIFVDHQFNATPDFFMNYSARVDDHQSFGEHLTWKIAPGYAIRSTGTRLKATYGTGFKAPSLSQLFDPSSGNANLNPERSKGWDIGFEQNLWGDKVVFGATVFRNNITNLVGFTTSAPFIGINKGKARTEGVETSFTYRPSLDWTVNGSYVYTYAKNRVSNQWLLRRPKHQANLDMHYQYSIDGDVGMHVRYMDKRRDIDVNSPFGRLDVKSFATIDVSSSYHLNPNLEIYGRLNNLLDKEYQEVFAYGTLGRTAYAGIKTRF